MRIRKLFKIGRDWEINGGAGLEKFLRLVVCEGNKLFKEKIIENNLIFL